MMIYGLGFMNKKTFVLPLLIMMLVGLFPTSNALAATTSASPAYSLPLTNVQTTTIPPAQILAPTSTGKLLGCSGAIVGEYFMPDLQYSYNVVWTLKHSLNDYYYMVDATDDAGSLAMTNVGSAGGIPTTYNYPKNTYYLNSSTPSKTVKLKVVAYNSQSIAESTVTCQISLTNKALPQIAQPAQTFTIPGLQQPSSTYLPITFGTTDSSSGTSSEDSSSGASAGNTSSGSSSSTTSGSSSGSTSGSSSSSGSGSSSSSGTSGSTYTPTSNSGSNSSYESTSSGSSSTTSASSEQTPLKPSPDLMSCKGTAKTLYFVNDAPAYDRMGITCFLTMPGIVKADVYTDSYDPKAEDNSANLIKMVLQDTLEPKGRVYQSWNGYDDYDQAVPLGKYKFVVEAKPAFGFAPDISIHSFEIKNPPAEVPATEQLTPPMGADNLHGAAAQAPEPGILEQLGEAVFGSQSANAKAVAEEAISPVNREASKCPNVFYPIDISGHPYQALIKKAYDECLVKGYPDGTFRIEQGLTRAEATKIIVLASGNLAKQGCYDNDCGTPFVDLDMWQGPWVRGAWDMKIVSGVSADRFDPNREITRAEAVALVVKAFKIPPHYGCYNAHCGAGLPDDPFNDIVQMWQGQYLRALTDKGILQTLTPGKFYPDQAITRGQFVEMVYRAKSLK